MKRHMDLVRQILIKIEQHDDIHPLRSIKIDGYSQNHVEGHVYLLYRAGFFEGDFRSVQGSARPCVYVISGLTWMGHDFLDAVRNDSVWARVKGKLAQVGGDAPLEVIKALAVKVVLDLVT